MATLESGDTPSCSISQTDERLLQKHGLENNGVSPLFTRGLKAIDRIEELKALKKQAERGDATLLELLSAIEEL